MGRKKRYRRDEVLLSAMAAFWEKGYHGTSLADLVATTGLNKNTLYTEFGSKADLFHDALDLYTERGLVMARAHLDQHPQGLENIRSYFRSMRYDSPCRGCLMTMTINEKNLVTPKSVALVGKTLAEIEALLLKNLVAGLQGEQEVVRARATRLATFLIFSIQGITTMGKYEGDQAKLDSVVETILQTIEM